MPDFDRGYAEQIITALDENGRLFPQFRITTENNRPKLIGVGGFSSVYEMHNLERPELTFALKVTGFERHTVSSEEFWSTGRIQWVLCNESRYIVRILDARELLISFDGNSISGVVDAKKESWEEQAEALHLQFVLMEKLDGIISKDRFRNAHLSDSKLSEESEVLKFALEIGQALNIAHGYRILHRDIKLENIFRDPVEEEYKLGDFGIAKYTEDGNAETIVYTDGYGAPEIERRLYDHYSTTADIYSFGISLYLLLNDLRFPGSEGYYPKVEVQYDPDYTFPAPVHASAGMTRVIRKMCSFRSEDRYQDMADVLNDLILVSEETEVDMSDELLEQISLTTETFHSENDQEGDPDDEREHVRTRAEIKEEQRARDLMYRSENVKYFVLLVLLFPIMFKGMQADATGILNPLFWVLPIAVAFESVLQRIKEFNLLFGIITLAFAGLSIYETGLTLPHIVMILSMVIGCPLLTAASAFGTGLWMLMEQTGKPGFIDFFARHDLGWVFLIIVLLAMNRYFYLRIGMRKTTDFRTDIGLFVYDKMFLVMAAIGMILLILQKSGIIVIPDIVERMHLIRTGIISFAGYLLLERIDSLLTDDGSKSENEGIDTDDRELDA